MKTIILNGSPRKNWNTALMLKEAQKGAESVGAETEYIDRRGNRVHRPLRFDLHGMPQLHGV